MRPAGWLAMDGGCQRPLSMGANHHELVLPLCERMPALTPQADDFPPAAYHRTVSTPCRYNLPVVALSRLYSPQFWQTAAGASRTMTTVLPRCKVTVTVPRAVSPTLQTIHLMSVPRPDIAPIAGCFGHVFRKFSPKHVLALRFFPFRLRSPHDLPTMIEPGRAFP